MNRRIIILFLILSVKMIPATSQETDNIFQSRIEYKLSWKATEQIKLFLAPEARLNESFNLDKFFIETGLEYSPVKNLSLNGSYRFITNQRDEKSTEILHRIALDAKFQTKIKRFRPSLRLRFTDYTEDQNAGSFLRYKAEMGYNIKKSPLKPEIGIEGFHDLAGKEIYKVRYSAGLKIPLFENHSLKLAYKLDFYIREYTNKHILNLGYRMNF